MGLNPYLLEMALAMVKKANVPPTPINAGASTIPQPAPPAPINAAPMPASQPPAMGGVMATTGGQVNQAAPPMGTSGGQPMPKQ